MKVLKNPKLIALFVFLSSVPAFADGGFPKEFGALIGLGLAAFGGALGQGKAAAAALDGIARNPSASNKIFMPMIIGLALIESLVIYALVIAFIKG